MKTLTMLFVKIVKQEVNSDYFFKWVVSKENSDFDCPMWAGIHSYISKCHTQENQSDFSSL